MTAARFAQKPIERIMVTQALPLSHGFQDPFLLEPLPGPFPLSAR